ncbi:sulfite exporter TauE/SafE family protein [Mesorhizobium sp. CAU 1741]|uniref:sulfite exporter TauE/SafE family protein n=1 Tax=Mesorhizobium sp. CAU 1741 TaxID=3140366 RepID=UPI00325AEB24
MNPLDWPFPPFDLPFLVLLAVVTLAGIARGISGFGTGMIVAPVAGAIYGPQAALAIVVLMDSLPTIPVTLPALRIAVWREVVPVAAGLFVCFPIGVFILVNGDEEVLRWLISLAILACVGVLWSRWTYHGPRNLATSFAVGGVAGTLSGIASVPGPPVIAYWMTAGLPAVLVRANLLSLFFIGEFVALGNLWIAGLFQWEVAMRALIAAPLYFAGIVAGTSAFTRGGERLYRIATFTLILAAAILALPVFDRVFHAAAAALGG